MSFSNNSAAKNQFADIDLHFVKINISVDPGVKFIDAITTQYFNLKKHQDNNLPILLELSNTLKVKNIIHNNNTLNYKHNGDSLIIYPDNEWSLNDSVTIKYDGVPKESGFGSVIFSKHGDTPIFWTLSEPNGAKDWFPCKQINTDKYDSSQVIVNCPEKYRAASNGIIVSETVNNNIRTTNWIHKHKIAFYLIAVAVTNYKISEEYIKLNNGDSLLFVNYYYPEDYEQNKSKAEQLIPALKMLCDTLGVYPFVDEKYGQAQFGWGGGMENQTMTFISYFTPSLMIHELAHQWFGNTITCSKWTDVWINEGFAEWCEGFAEEVGVGEINDPVAWRKNKIYSAASKPNGSIYVTDTTDVWEIFDTRMTYDKGCMLLHMLRIELGDQTFFNLLKNYIKNSRHRFGNCSAEEFVNFVNEFTGNDYRWFFNQWFYGHGMPVYKVLWQQNDDKLLNLKIEQHRKDSTIAFFRAKVPVMIYGTNGEKQFVQLNNTVENQFFTLNPNFKVDKISFDPYGDILSWGSTTKKQNLAADCIVKTRQDKNQLFVNISKPKVYTRYLIKNFNLTTVQSGKLPNDGSFTIDLRRLPSGEYYISLEGADGYFSKRLSVGKK